MPEISSKSVPCFSLSEKDIVRREDFGAFEVILAKDGAMFKTYQGYHVWCSVWTADATGKAVEKNLYQWLKRLVEYKDVANGHESEPISDDASVTKGDLLDGMKIMTEANLLRPMTIFIDEERAVDSANEYIRWLGEQMKSLEAASTVASPDDGGKIMAEEAAGVAAQEAVMSSLAAEGRA